MANRLDVFKCELCGNIVELFHAGAGQLVCCGKPMTRLAENTVDASKEKHIPVVETIDEGIKVKIGSVAHPMEETHFIEWIEVINGDYNNVKFLKPGDKPEADFYVGASDKLVVREFCNLHGLWKK
jgi:superoxide reductase